MPQRNHIKADNDSLRGVGKLGWTERGAVLNTLKKLEATFEGKPTPAPSKSHKITVVCPVCKKKFKNNSGNLPPHKPRWSFQNCSHPSYFIEKPTIKEKLVSVEINGETITKGDKIMFNPYPWSSHFGVDDKAIIEAEVKAVYLMSNNLEFMLIDARVDPFPIRIFHGSKNFLKL